MNSQAFNEGIDAYSAGLFPEDNPYHEHTEEFFDWAEGMTSAREVEEFEEGDN